MDSSKGTHEDRSDRERGSLMVWRGEGQCPAKNRRGRPTRVRPTCVNPCCTSRGRPFLELSCPFQLAIRRLPRNPDAELCRRFRVERLFVFGSAAPGGFRPGSSDTDFLVRLADRGPTIDYAYRFLDLADELEILPPCGPADRGFGGKPVPQGIDCCDKATRV